MSEAGGEKQTAVQHETSAADDGAAATLRRALISEPHSVPALVGLGRLALRSGDDAGALDLFGQVITLSGSAVDPKVHRAMATACRRLGRLAEAETHYHNALSLTPWAIDDHLSLGNIVLAQGRPKEALALYEAAAALAPGDGLCPYHAGLALTAISDYEAAIAAYRLALTLTPDLWQAVGNLAGLLGAQGRVDDAEALLRQSLSHPGAPARLFTRLASILKDRGQTKEALEACRCALDRDSAEAPALILLGALLAGEDQLEEALETFERALVIEPQSAQALFNLGNIHKDLGDGSKAIALYDRALVQSPGLAAARFARCMAWLSPLHESQDALRDARDGYRRALTALDTDCEGPLAYALADGVGASQPFYLAYQGQNDRDLQALYGRIVVKAMQERYPPPVRAPAIVRSRIRVGFVSGYFRRHANWTLPLKGWLTRLDRSKFHLAGYHTGRFQDGETDAARGLCDHFIQGPLSFDAWRAAICAGAPDVLIFAEIGMDPMAVRLAAVRLAAVQCASWGHPATSGLPTIDYFISSDLMEPADANDHYTETLIRLPNLSIYCEPPPPPQRTTSRSKLGLPESGCVYWCGQPLQKYLPDYDDVFARIAKAAPDCRFIFIVLAGSPALTERFRRRLDSAFALRGLDAAKSCIFLPRLDTQAYTAALGASDVFLDSIGWSGCNSTLEALAFDLPVVTLPGAMMRSRHSAAMLQMMKIHQTIAADLDDYVALAVSLGTQPQARRAASIKVAERKHRLYRDDACIAGLERFLWDTGRVRCDETPGARHGSAQ